ncbi:hypothetical protein FA15DRAFT_670165 [Coprinopsis marcescibilis]|uniref:Uncharacterized protein n=1 Tax=Coprinopsis marcescibilis TaxID=230819 RepID=A0A5C3KU24_COPMA|nr:hypothetical protein FA15DRAFT_670165 [Coprinopsis marcescibilis]
MGTILLTVYLDHHICPVETTEVLVKWRWEDSQSAFRAGIANINTTNKRDRTELVHAAEHSYFADLLDTVSAVLGVDCSLPDVQGSTVLMVAVEQGLKEILELLRKVGG